MNEPSPLAIALRNLRGSMSADDIAHRISVTSRTLYNYEAGITVPSWLKVRAIGRVTKRDVESLRPLWEEADSRRYAARMARRAAKKSGAVGSA